MPGLSTLPSWRWHLAICLGLAVLTLVCLGNVCSCAFAGLDDSIYVIDNPLVHKGLTVESCLEALTSEQGNFWQPMVWLSFQFDATLTGYGKIAERVHAAEQRATEGKHGLDRDDDPLYAGAWVFHATNLLLHVVNVLLTYWVMYRLTGAAWRSAMIAALFAVHPLHVESVAWVTERKDVLSALFFLLALLSYVGYARRPGMGRYLLVFLFTLLGLASKPMVVTLPAVLLLLDFWPLGRVNWGQKRLLTPLGDTVVVSWKRAVLEKVPLFALSLAVSAVTLHVQLPVRMSVTDLSGENRLAGAATGYAWYLATTFWPSNLCTLYLYHARQEFSPPVILNLLFLLGLSYYVLARARQAPQAAVGWFWFLGMLFPVIGLFQSGPQMYADRFTYIPHLGFFLWVVWSAGDALERWRVPVPARATLCGCVLGLLGLATYHQVAWWHDTPTMAKRCWDLDNRNHRAAAILAVYYCDHADFDKAIDWGDKALQASATMTKVSQVPSYYSLVGRAYAEQGRKDLAQACLDKMMNLPPQADTPREIALLSLKLGHFQQAEHFFRVFLERNPNDQVALRALRRLEKLRSTSASRP